MASPDYGAQAFLWWRGEIADRDLTLMKNAGFRWVKQWFAWDDIEGAGRGQYDWSIPDRIVSQAEEHGLNLLVRVDREPAWAGPPPQNSAAFQEFLAELATALQGPHRRHPDLERAEPGARVGQQGAQRRRVRATAAQLRTGPSSPSIPT